MCGTLSRNVLFLSNRVGKSFCIGWAGNLETIRPDPLEEDCFCFSISIILSFDSCSLQVGQLFDFLPSDSSRSDVSYETDSLDENDRIIAHKVLFFLPQIINLSADISPIYFNCRSARRRSLQVPVRKICRHLLPSSGLSQSYQHSLESSSSIARPSQQPVGSHGCLADDPPLYG